MMALAKLFLLGMAIGHCIAVWSKAKAAKLEKSRKGADPGQAMLRPHVAMHQAATLNAGTSPVESCLSPLPPVVIQALVFAGISPQPTGH